MDYEIKCYLSAYQNLYHASYIYTGLCELSRQGRARVRFVVPRGEKKFCAADSLTVCLEVKARGTGKSSLLAIDLRDRSDVFTPDALQSSDLYMKRSYYEPDMVSLPAALKPKIIPFGLNYACRSAASTPRVMKAILPHYALDFLRSSKRAFGHAKRFSEVMRQYLATSSEKEFEKKPDESAEASVLFQTRVYLPEEIEPDDPHEVNEERVALVRALKKAFGDKFRGGLVPTAYAKEHYPDAVSSHSSRQSEYIEMSKRSLIAIYTRGLHHSLAFKLPEYLASSKCVISSPLRNQLPAPLVKGKHYLQFQTPEECVERCADLLRDSEEAARLRHESWRYYQEEVTPASHLLKCLRRATLSNV